MIPIGAISGDRSTLHKRRRICAAESPLETHPMQAPPRGQCSSSHRWMAGGRFWDACSKLFKGMVARDGIEPPTAGPFMAAGNTTARRAKPERGVVIDLQEWWPGTGLNRRRRPFQGRALPLSYLASVQTSVAFLRVDFGGCRKKWRGHEQRAATTQPVYQFPFARDKPAGRQP